MMWGLTPSLSQPVKFLGWIMYTQACKRCTFRFHHKSSFSNMFWFIIQQYVLIEIFSHTNGKKKKKAQSFKFLTLLLVVFRSHHGSEGVNFITACDPCMHQWRSAKLDVNIFFFLFENLKKSSVRAGLKVSLSLWGFFFGVQLLYPTSKRQHVQHGQTGTPVIVACKNETPLTPLLSFTKVNLEICT